MPYLASPTPCVSRRAVAAGKRWHWFAHQQFSYRNRAAAWLALCLCVVTALPAGLLGSPVASANRTGAARAGDEALSDDDDDDAADAALARQPTATEPMLRLPAPVADPLHIDPAEDPFLALGRNRSGRSTLTRAVAEALNRSPAIGQAESGESEASALRDVARSGLFPTIDTAFTYRTRNHGYGSGDGADDPGGMGRTDAMLSLDQRLFDFGATSARIRAASQRLRAAVAQSDGARLQTVVATIDAWTEVQATAALTDLALSYGQQLVTLRDAMAQRAKNGLAAVGDVVRLDSAIATNDVRSSRVRQQWGAANARFYALAGGEAPPSTGRAPPPDRRYPTYDGAVAAALVHAPQLQGSEAQRLAAEAEAGAYRADRLPMVSAGVDAGRFAQPEIGSTRNRYAVRGRVTVRQRLFGGVGPRASAAEARAEAEAFHSEAVRRDLVRETMTLWSDLAALDARIEAAGRAYFAARVARDVVSERFRVSRGTLLDLLSVNEACFAAAADYVTTLAERDTTGYALFARTGDLGPLFGLTPEGAAPKGNGDGPARGTHPPHDDRTAPADQNHEDRTGEDPPSP